MKTNTLKTPISSKADNLKQLKLKKMKENNDHKTPDDLSNEVSRIDVDEIVSNQQQYRDDIQREQPNRINQMDFSPVFLIKSNNNQEPEVNQQILNTILSTLHGKSDFQICLSNLDDSTYQQLQNILQESPQLDYTSSNNIKEKEIHNESLNNSEIRDEMMVNRIQQHQINPSEVMGHDYIVNINAQQDNNVSQQIRWYILNLKCLKQFQQTVNESNQIIVLIPERYQYRLVSESFNQSDQKQLKNRIKFQVQFQDYLDSMVILTLQCYNHEEDYQISRIQNDQIIMKQFNQAFKSKNVIIDKIKFNEIELIIAIVYNYFDIPINQLQYSFSQIIQNFRKRKIVQDYYEQDTQKQQNQIFLPKIKNESKIIVIGKYQLQKRLIQQLPKMPKLKIQQSGEHEEIESPNLSDMNLTRAKFIQ